MGMLSQIFGAKRRERVDARDVYRKIMAQSRRPEFFGQGRVPDTYEGRIEWLTFHMAFVMKAMQTQGEEGRKLSQALFDEMVDDFDVSLREEGFTDTGVKKRIKPMVKLFYERLKAFTETDTVADLEAALRTGECLESDAAFLMSVAVYGKAIEERFSDLTLGQLATADFDFPSLTT